MGNYVLIILAVAILLILGSDLTTATQRLRYDNYHVYQVLPRTDAQLTLLQSMDGQRSSYIFLSGVLYVDTSVHMIVAPERVADFEKQLQDAAIFFELLERNAQAQLEDNEVADPNRRDGEYSWIRYHELNDTYNWMHSLAKSFPKQASIFLAGKSYEGRDILGIKISYGADKKAIFVEAGMHAREWISPATSTFIANQLLNSKNENIRLIAENFDWYIVPHANPDGYFYTHTTDRLWRKTRKPYDNGCYGADPNRNWDTHWNEAGSSNNPCTDTYAGPHAFSEIEARTLAEYVTTLKGKLLLYLSFHSYSQLLLFPYGYTGDLPANYDDLKRVYNAAIKGIKRRYGTKYTGGNIHDAIYAASGSSIDWAYDQADVKYAYCYELRPAGKNFWIGFKLPASQIIPTGEETLDSIVEMIKEIASK